MKSSDTVHFNYSLPGRELQAFIKPAISEKRSGRGLSIVTIWSEMRSIGSWNRSRAQ